MQYSRIVFAPYAIALMVATAGCSGGSGSDGPTGPVTTTGSLKVIVVTTGTELDADGYTVVIGSTTGNVGVNGDVTVTGLAPGSYDVTLEGVSTNCYTPFSGARPISIV